MKLIQSTKGQIIKVCDCHYDKVKHWRWSAKLHSRRENPNKKYVPYRMEWNGQKYVGIMMGRFILDCPTGMVVDHINGDSMDNRCKNLRIVTQGQNALNNHKAKFNSKSGHKGVYWHKAANKWCAEVVYNHKKYYLGVFKNKLDAVETYNNKAKELHGQFFVKS